MNTKKILFIVIFVVLVIGFGLLIYFVFFGNKATIPANNENAVSNVNAALPVNSLQNINRLTNIASVNTITNISTPSNVNITGPTNVARGGVTTAEVVLDDIHAAELTANGDGIRYYDDDEGKFYWIDLNGDKHELSDQFFPDVKEVEWSPNGNQAVVSFPDNSNIMYDFEKGQQVTLPKEWDDIAFSPNGSKLGFKNNSENEGNRWLAVSDPNGSGVSLIEPLGDKADDVDVNWSPNGQVVALFREGYSGSAQETYLIGLYGENFKSIVTNGRGFEGLWSPTGEQLLYSVYSAATRYNPTLYLVDSSGDNVGSNQIQLGLQTWSSKCAFAKQSPDLYCAVPRYLADGSGLSPNIVGSTNDSIYKINTNTGSKTLIALPSFASGDTDYSITTMFLSSNENILYIGDSESGNLYSINLE